MTSLTRPLLSGEDRDTSATLPALQKLLQLAYSEDTDEQLEAVMGISKMIERRRFEASLFAPLCHTLSRLVVSEQRTVVAYAARGIKLLVLDDALRPQATVAGIPSVLAAALGEWEDDAPCLREILGGLQTLCCDKSTVLAVVNAGALGPVLELLGTSNLEIRQLSTAIAANVLSFSDSLLLTNEEVIDAFSDFMGALLDAVKSGDGPVRDYGLAALANACAHPVLAGRARELGALELLRAVDTNATSGLFRSSYVRLMVLRKQRAVTAVSRMNRLGLRAGDIEEGGVGGAGGGGGEGAGGAGGGPGKLQFYSFKWGVKPSVAVSFSPRDRLWAFVGVLFWTSIVLLTLWPVMGY